VSGPVGTLALAAALVMAAVMLAVWAVSARIRNAGIVDIAWAGGFAVVAPLYALLGDGAPARRALIAGMAVVWSLRLAVYLYRRVMGHHPVEDGRYVQLRRDWGARAGVKFLVFFQVQGLLVVVLSLPFLLACLNPAPAIHPLEWAAAALWAVAVAGEALADRQLERFKRDPAARGRVCRVGLWRYSRHPNYFFEWLTWCAYFLFALASPWGVLTVVCPLLMLHFLFRVTGIPATEAQALRTKGEAYREYQRTTSAFVPWFPRAEGR
jgi:steroid 5-alpha reductase family enzyme